MGSLASTSHARFRAPASEVDGPERIIAHIDLDAFYVSVELQRHPELKGLPVVVSGDGPRAVVTTASYEARKHGVGSAMPAAKARRLCPDAIFIRPDHSHYREASNAVMAILLDHFDTVEQMGLDEAYVDLSGFSAPSAAMRRAMNEIEASTGLHSSVGIGPNRLVAKIASDADKPRGFVVLTHAQAITRFSGSPCTLLPGIGPRTGTRLGSMGVHTIGELASCDPAGLIERFGRRQGPHLIDLANFVDSTPVRAHREAVSESRETTFDTDVSDMDALCHRLDMLVGELCAALKRHGHRGRTIGIKVRYDDFETHTRARTIEAPTNDPVRVSEVASRLLVEFSPERPVRLLGVRVAGFDGAEDRADQLTLPIA